MKFSVESFLPGYTSEKEVKAQFRNEVSSYLGCTYTVPVSNGTIALEVALRSLKLERGDHVIVPDISFIATATAVANCGLIPVYADVSKEYFGLTLASIQERITPEVKAVILVHFSGIVNREIFEIRYFCQSLGITLIEDCAQAFSCSAQGIKAGALGDIGTFSFQSSKIINCGEGGLVTTNNPSIGTTCEAIADWGMSPSFIHRNLELASSNFRLSAVQCYFLTQQVMHIEEITSARREICLEIEKACQKYGITSCLPEPRVGFVDCPFFFPLQSTRNINMIEPREESPMHRSTLVISILKQFHPDLIEKYHKVNPPELFKEYTSNTIVAHIDFINIHQVFNTPVEDWITNYLDTVPCTV